MKTRKDWSWKEWIARYVCILSSLGLFFYGVNFAFHAHYRFIPLLFGAAMILQGLAWAPYLLLVPDLPKPTTATQEAVEISRIASFLLTHGGYWLIFGLVAVSLFPS